jgi:hypothetical protein
MSLFHRHQWQEVARRFVPPVQREFNVEGSGIDEGTIYDLMHGYTVVEFRCSECGKVSSAHLQGDATG